MFAHGHADQSAPGVPPLTTGGLRLDKGEQAVDLAVANNEESVEYSRTITSQVAEVPRLIRSLAASPLSASTCPQLFTLANQGVIVTGGARGLGLCIAQALLEAEASRVYCLDVLPSPAVEEWAEAQKTAKKHGGSLEYRRLDITDSQAVKATFADIYESCPCPIKGFFGAAGIQQMIPALDYPAADFERVMKVNVTGTFLTIQAAAREMVGRNIKGSIVITASMSGSIANKGLTCLAYNTSKSALLQMCRSAAAEWGAHGIRVNASTLSPGYIRTVMTDQLLAQRPDLEEEWLRGSMLQRLSTPDEFRGPVLFLLSNASSFMTGADLMIDGGHTAF